MFEDFWSVVGSTLLVFFSGLFIGLFLADKLELGDMQCTATGIVDGRAVCITYQRKENKQNE